MGKFTRELATNGLVYNETLSAMQQRYVKPLECPEWAADMLKFRRVLAGKLMQSAYCYGEVPSELDDIRAIEAQAVLHLAKGKDRCRAMQSWFEATTRLGGPLAYLTAIAWRRFRLGQTSTTISEALGVSPCAVRRQAAGLALVARRLYPDPQLHLPQRHNSKTTVKPFGLRRPIAGRYLKTISNSLISSLRAEGLSYRAIGREVGLSTCGVRNRLLAVTRDAHTGDNYGQLAQTSV